MTLNQTLISTTKLNANASSVTIAVPSGYTDMRLLVSARDNTTGDAGGNYYTITFNGTGTTSTIYLQGNGSSTNSSTLSNLAGISTTNASGSTPSTFCNDEIYIPDYSASGAKSYFVDTVTERNGTSAYATIVCGLWSGSGAVTSITLTPASFGSFVADSTFTLYGVTKLGVTPTLTPKATGGDIITNDGTYWIHTFYSTGAFIPQTTLSCDYLVVAGGGAGGGSWGGGGGAGGYRAGSALAFDSGTIYSVTVGAGAAGALSTGANGGNSSISTITSTGGGGGGYYFGNGANGGSGGGGAGGYGGTGNRGVGGAGNTPSTTPSQGNAGGTGIADPSYGSQRYGAGGGGASSAGSNATSGGSGAGGSGTANSISGTSVTYAAGGNGNSLGGGAGAANTGKGGAGGNESVAGSNGGSGIVIVRYAMA